MAPDGDEAVSTGTASSGSARRQPSSSGRAGAGPRPPAGCLVCAAALQDAAPYYQRIKICKACMTAAEVQFGGKAQRFCQQCSRLHPVDRFDGTLRSCREQLARHAERRRLLRKARKQQQAQAQQGEAAAAPPQWQPWQSDNDPAAKRQRLDPLPPFPACPPATFAALPPLPMFADLAGQIPSADSVLLSSATAFSANSLLPPFHSGPLPSVASVLMPPLPLPGSAQPPNSQPAASIETLAAAAELELKQAGQPAAEEPPGLQLPPAQFHLPQQQQQQAPQPNMFGPLQLLLQQQGAAALQAQQAQQQAQQQQQQQQLLALLGQQRPQEQGPTLQQGAGTQNTLLTLLMQLLPYVQPAAQAPPQPAPQLSILQSLQQQVVQTLLQQAAGMAPPAAPPAPVAPQPHPFLDQLMRTMQPAQPQALPATSQALASLLQSLPVPATSNPSQQPPSTQAP